MHPSAHNPLPLGRKLAFAAFAVLLTFTLLEGAARLAVTTSPGPPAALPTQPGWQTQFFRFLFDWHEPDPRFLWRFRPNLNNQLIRTNSRGLIADETPFEKPPGAMRILILGDSSPVGLGLQNRTAAFPDILKRLLRRQIPSETTVEVINTAVSGYSSEQILRFYECEGSRYSPDAVVLYCGNNDASISGIWTDQELLDRQNLVGLRRLLHRLALYRLMAELISGPADPDTPNPSTGSPLAPRVPPERFRENLARLAQLCRHDQARLIILVPPVPLLWPAGLQFRPLRHVSLDNGELIFPAAIAQVLGRNLHYCLDDHRFAFLYGDADMFTRLVYGSAPADQLSPDEEIPFWTTEAQSHPDPLSLNNLAVAQWRVGNFPLADSLFAAAIDSFTIQNPRDDLPFRAAASPLWYNRGINALSLDGFDTLSVISPHLRAAPYLDSALQLDWFSLRVKQPYVEILRSMARTENVTVLDLNATFSGKHERLFTDHCHPTAEGHRLIADTLAATLLSPLP